MAQPNSMRRMSWYFTSLFEYHRCHIIHLYISILGRRCYPVLVTRFTYLILYLTFLFYSIYQYLCFTSRSEYHRFHVTQFMFDFFLSRFIWHNFHALLIFFFIPFADFFANGEVSVPELWRHRPKLYIICYIRKDKEAILLCWFS